MTIDNITTVLIYVSFFLTFILFIQYRNKINKLRETVLDKEFELFFLLEKNKSLKNSVTSYKGWNTTHRKDIAKLQKQLEAVQKDCTKNTNLTNKTDEKTTSNRKKNTRNEKTARKNEKRKNKS